MAYSSIVYLLPFLGAVVLLYNGMPKKYRWWVLLLASYIFYWLNSPTTLIFLLLSTVAVYLAGIFLNKIQDGFDLSKKALDKEGKKQLRKIVGWQKKAVCAFALLFIFGLLAFLKYYPFVSENVNQFLKLLHLENALPSLKLLLPLGISYYTLQAAGYIIDVYRGKYRADMHLGKVALFLSFFPQIVEGPIARFDETADQLMEGNRSTYQNLTWGVQLILWGLFKKMVIADRANPFVAEVFKNYAEQSGVALLVGGILFTIQIYMEFSGCMDIVIGSAQLFGINLPKNFARPFFATSVNDFWRRWHITLGAWLRDYIFYSVSLSKGFAKLSKKAKEKLTPFLGALIPSAAALFCVWICNGIWHGAGWKYLAYGMYYYVIMLLGMLLEPLFAQCAAKLKLNREGSAFRIVRILRTCILVVGGMTLFRAETVGVFGEIVYRIFTNFAPQHFYDGTLLHMCIDGWDFIAIAAGCVVVLFVSILQEKGYSLREHIAGQNIVIRWSVYLALILAVIIFGAYGSGYDQVAFIYGQF
ncbi:MAG: MBOAT family protein [Clostridiales bacterium]|jgi:alginate O-acetyltransferase complex protein AlgI|nr:MBOAT family protein [Clostridiales bacterium]